MKAFLDMDGVLADFVKGACLAHNRLSPYESPAAYEVFEIEKLWMISASEFWSRIDAIEGFWEKLEKTIDADQIVELVCKRFGSANVAILTSPSLDPGCIAGKRKWMDKHYPFLADKMIFTSAKSFIAARDRVLIDDRDSNIEEFIRAGGIGIHVPRLWNSKWNEAHRPVFYLEWRINDLNMERS